MHLRCSDARLSGTYIYSMHILSSIRGINKLILTRNLPETLAWPRSSSPIIEYNIVFGMEVTSIAVGGALAGTIEIVISIRPELDRVVSSKTIICDKVGNSAGDSAIPAERSCEHSRG